MDRRLYIITSFLIISLATNILLCEYILLNQENDNVENDTPKNKIFSAPKTAIKVPAISDYDNQGIIIEIIIEIREGNGNILVNTEPLMGVAFQESARTAVSVTANLLNLDLSDADVIFTVNASDSTSIDGPSAGAAMTVLLYSAITGMLLNQSIMMTGTIQNDGSIGEVGGITEKIEAGSEIGITRFLVPPGQSVQTKWIQRERVIDLWIFQFVTYFYEPETINLKEYAWNNYNIELIEVEEINQVIDLSIIV